MKFSRLAGLIPLPELTVVLVTALIVLGARTLRDAGRLPFARRFGNVRQAEEEYALQAERQRARLIASCIVFAIISIPHILRLVPPNGVYGFRTAATQSNRAIWYQANAFSGWALLVASAIGATTLLILPTTARRWLVWAAFLVPVFGALAASSVYLTGLIDSPPF